MTSEYTRKSGRYVRFSNTLDTVKALMILGTDCSNCTCVSVVASAVTNGTSTRRAKILAINVLPEPARAPYILLLI